MNPTAEDPRPPLPPFTRETAILKVRLAEDAWKYDGNRIAVRFAYEWHDDTGGWFRSYGNENWEFDELGLMAVRHASINDLPIADADRKFRWPPGRRPDDQLPDAGPGTSARTPKSRDRVV